MLYLVIEAEAAPWGGLHAARKHRTDKHEQRDKRLEQER